MDPKVAWIQPEVFGPATELWQRLWENSNREAEEYNNQIEKPNQTSSQLSEAQREQQLQKESRLQAELGIKQLSPLSQLISSENAACMIRVSHVNQLRVLEKSDHLQNLRVCSVAQLRGIPFLKFQKNILWSIFQKSSRENPYV